MKALRARLGLTQTELAYLFGVHVITVSKWERGKALPSAWQEQLCETIMVFARPEDLLRCRMVLRNGGPIVALAKLIRPAAEHGWGAKP